jgi:hypothetical protein
MAIIHYVIIFIIMWTTDSNVLKSKLMLDNCVCARAHGNTANNAQTRTDCSTHTCRFSTTYSFVFQEVVEIRLQGVNKHMKSNICIHLLDVDYDVCHGSKVCKRLSKSVWSQILKSYLHTFSFDFLLSTD